MAEEGEPRRIEGKGVKRAFRVGQTTVAIRTMSTTGNSGLVTFTPVLLGTTPLEPGEDVDFSEVSRNFAVRVTSGEGNSLTLYQGTIRLRIPPLYRGWLHRSKGQLVTLELSGNGILIRQTNASDLEAEEAATND